MKAWEVIREKNCKPTYFMNRGDALVFAYNIYIKDAANSNSWADCFVKLVDTGYIDGVCSVCEIEINESAKS